ncbi:hypothetical protein FQK07_03245 [Synechococcus sp. BSF8S]|uniref:hypothetical protein n=1 Tax=Synechococcus sp. BSA11S TaxID=2599077 RepID=UPI00162A81D6|nr:hypothetical protein [Synechococcus sp. BSA11S]MBC1260292.1 hypothetical protein [Synechococcus sp. BSF8S]
MILLLMVAVAFVAIGLSGQLARLTMPLAARLAQLHQDDSEAPELGDRLERIKNRYIALLSHVDQVDAAEFSAGEIETISLPFVFRQITAASAQSWLRQAPGILISLGLLGTFAGLTIGLSEIAGALAKNASTEETMTALSGIVAPMGAAFQTSLLGLFLSLLVLIWTQIVGTRNCLERCEALLSSWLETVLPQQLDSKVMAPLRKSIQDLNKSAGDLPLAVYNAVESAMKDAFSAKLKEIFDVNTSLTSQAQIAVRQLGSVANAFNESGQDFVQAAQAFRDTDFATTLQQSVQSLQESQEQITASSDGLSARLVDVRDSLMSTQAEWKLLAKTAETELQSCRLASQQIQKEIQSLQQASMSLDQSNQSAVESSKQLREARLEVMRDRKLALEVAESVRARLAADASVAESCQVFASALETALSNWNRNVVRLDDLTSAFVTTVQNAKLEDDALLAERSKHARETIEQLTNQLQQDLGAAIDTQRSALAQLDQPTLYAQNLSQGLVQLLGDLESRLLNLASLARLDGRDADRGR